jgi:hypothetical protein
MLLHIKLLNNYKNIKQTKLKFKIKYIFIANGATSCSRQLTGSVIEQLVWLMLEGIIEQPGWSM